MNRVVATAIGTATGSYWQVYSCALRMTLFTILSVNKDIYICF